HSPCDDHHRMVDCILLLVRRGRVRSLPLDCCNHCACLVSRWIAAISNGGGPFPQFGGPFFDLGFWGGPDISSSSPPPPPPALPLQGTRLRRDPDWKKEMQKTKKECATTTDDNGSWRWRVRVLIVGTPALRNAERWPIASPIRPVADN